MTKTNFKLLPEWSLNQVGKSLIISGGADARYEIELETDEPSFFSDLIHTKSFNRNEINERDSRVLEELIAAEIIIPVLNKSKTFKVGMIGDHKLLINSQKNIKTANFLLISRTNSTYAELLEKIEYSNISKPHLFVDMAFHHTLSIGPLVFPGETACIACLQGRITRRWGDDKPPISPRMTDKYLGLATELIKSELSRIENGDTSLTNKTYSWNFQDRVIRKDQLLKVPLCLICTENKIDHSGALALPWGKDESITNTV